ncbi:hypothetical protein Zmor_004212 [Zophobas morio]|uniref:Uncharacterized protein n=1 Tax=Zophobas morio TaxID=2755281 RepID=A0AA38M030_9CUCU|nr:hypothetical protein Zmor_004212 [Zophobas morio]
MNICALISITALWEFSFDHHFVLTTLEDTLYNLLEMEKKITKWSSFKGYLEDDLSFFMDPSSIYGLNDAITYLESVVLESHNRATDHKTLLVSPLILPEKLKRTIPKRRHLKGRYALTTSRTTNAF